MAATEAQMQAMQEAEDIDTGVDTRTKEEMLADQMKGLSSAGKTAVESIPGVGEVIVTKEIAEDISAGDYLSAGIGTAALGVGFLPAGDILNKPLRAAAKKLRKVDKDAATKMLSDVDSIETWKKQNPNPKPQKQNPDVEKSANDLLEGKITGKQHRSVVKENMPIVKIDEVPEMPSFTEIVGALDKDKSAKGILGLNKSVKDGTRVSSRLDIPAYERFDKWVVSVHDAFDKKGRESLNGDIVGYGKTAILKNVDFKGLPQGAANIAAKRNPKGTIARIFGDYYNAEPENVAEYARQVIKDKNWTQVGYNPFRHGFFYDKDTGMPVKSAEEVIQVGPLVLAKNAQKIKISEAKQVGPKGGIKIRAGKPIKGLQNLKETKTVFNEGGAVMQKQMEMFEDGGLMDEGGTVDPVSGNDVPPGSTQEEVRDDIPAQLSEGEFVFPADVVRYIGLGNLMRMRQEAKMGLKLMEQMGQMGNSEEATMPDDLPFDINDLDMEDEIDDNNELKMQVGGFVQPTQQQQQMGISGYQQAVAPTTGVAAVPQQAASQQYVQPVQPVQAAVPTMQAYKPEEVPTFQQTIGDDGFGTYDELRQYRNEAGNIINVPFRNGQPISPIPEGYTFVDPEETATEEVTTTPTTPQTTSVRQDASKDERQEQRQREEEEEFGPGGGRLGIDKTIYGVSFEGINPLTQGRSLLGSLLSGGMIPANLVDGISVNLQNKDGKFNVTGQEYNAIKQSIKEHGANSEITSSLMDKLRLDAKTREAQRAAAAAKREEERVNAAAIIRGDDKDSSIKGESYDVSKKGAALEASLKSSPTPGGKGVGRQDYSGGGNRPDSKSEEKSSSSGPPSGSGKSSSGSGKSSSGSSSSGSSSKSSGGSYGAKDSTGGFRRFDEGGLASKPKPKTKKMKRGGLASKK